MSKFEEIGVAYQQNAASKAEAGKRFSTSCRICASHGLCIECDRCAIAAAHSFAVACFDMAKTIAPQVCR